MARSVSRIDGLMPGRAEAATARAATDDDYAALVARIVPQGRRQDALLPTLHAIQRELGYIDDAVVPHIASALNISRADVHGVITFYHDFRRMPPGRHVIRICRAESCQARGGKAVEREIVSRVGVGVGETSADGTVTIDRIHCFGLCAIGPNVMVDGRITSKLDADRAGALIDRIFTS